MLCDDDVMVLRAVTWATVNNSCMDILVDTDHVMEQLA